MSKERARLRAARERESAIKAAARAAEAERRERQAARAKVLRRVTAGFRPPGSRSTGRQTGILARRRRIRTSLLIAFLIAFNVLVWVVRPDWAARLAALIFSVLAAPVLATLLFPRRS